MRVFVCLMILLLSGCLGGDADGEPDETPTALDDQADRDGPAVAEPGPPGPAEDAFEPSKVFEGRLEATGVGEDAQATFEVPEGARRVEVQALGPDDLAAGRFGIVLESPSGEVWEVYAAYGYRAPTNAVVVEYGDGTIDVDAEPGTWTLHLEADGSADVGVVVTAV